MRFSSSHLIAYSTLCFLPVQTIGQDELIDSPASASQEVFDEVSNALAQVELFLEKKQFSKALEKSKRIKRSLAELGFGSSKHPVAFTQPSFFDSKDKDFWPQDVRFEDLDLPVRTKISQRVRSQYKGYIKLFMKTHLRAASLHLKSLRFSLDPPGTEVCAPFVDTYEGIFIESFVSPVYIRSSDDTNASMRVLFANDLWDEFELFEFEQELIDTWNAVFDTELEFEENSKLIQMLCDFKRKAVLKTMPESTPIDRASRYVEIVRENEWSYQNKSPKPPEFPVGEFEWNAVDAYDEKSVRIEAPRFRTEDCGFLPLSAESLHAQFHLLCPQKHALLTAVLWSSHPRDGDKWQFEKSRGMGAIEEMEVRETHTSLFGQNLTPLVEELEGAMVDETKHENYQHESCLRIRWDTRGGDWWGSEVPEYGIPKVQKLGDYICDLAGFPKGMLRFEESVVAGESITPMVRETRSHIVAKRKQWTEYYAWAYLDSTVFQIEDRSRVSDENHFATNIFCKRN